MKLVREHIYEDSMTPFSNKEGNKSIRATYPLSKIQYEDADKSEEDEEEPLEEKFSSKGDPISDMGIGSFKNKIDFSIDEERIDFIIDLLPKILDTPEIPKDIINEKGYLIKNMYYSIINPYVEKYLSVNGNYEYEAESNLMLLRKLYYMGFEIPPSNIYFIHEMD